MNTGRLYRLEWGSPYTSPPDNAPRVQTKNVKSAPIMSMTGVNLLFCLCAELSKPTL